MRLHKMIKWLILLLATFMLLANCGTLGYYAHNIHGHFSMLAQQQPIDEIIGNPNTDALLKKRLQLSVRYLNFAQNQLLLTNHGSYHNYVALNKPYIKWNVIAAPELSIHPKLWCFMVIGCVSYRGYYDEKMALQFAEGLQQKGLETHISGAIAYSTLGWFDDPLLSSMMRWSDLRMAEFIFHELAHQKLFISGDQDFNEAFATMVAEYGIKRWSQMTEQSSAMQTFHNRKRKEQAFIKLALQTREKLADVYASDQEDSVKRAQKHLILDQLRTTYKKMLSRGEIFRYDDWFEHVNNAKLAALASYRRLVPAFFAILEHHGHDLRVFYQYVHDLGQKSKRERRNELERWLKNATHTALKH